MGVAKYKHTVYWTYLLALGILTQSNHQWYDKCTKPQFMTDNKEQAEPELPFLWETNRIYLKVYQLLKHFRLCFITTRRGLYSLLP